MNIITINIPIPNISNFPRIATERLKKKKKKKYVTDGKNNRDDEETANANGIIVLADGSRRIRMHEWNESKCSGWRRVVSRVQLVSMFLSFCVCVCVCFCTQSRHHCLPWWPVNKYCSSLWPGACWRMDRHTLENVNIGRTWNWNCLISSGHFFFFFLPFFLLILEQHRWLADNCVAIHVAVLIITQHFTRIGIGIKLNSD